jgi:hypothetical protein
MTKLIAAFRNFANAPKKSLKNDPKKLKHSLHVASVTAPDWCVCVCVYIYIYIHTHTYIYIHI